MTSSISVVREVRTMMGTSDSRRTSWQICWPSLTVEQHQVGRGGENIARDMLERFAGLDFKPGAGKDVDKLTTNGLVVLNDID